ncbi:hypothetical protein K8I61_16925 [bacterium]|nr:hypothetical protein [bacterium]
MRRTGTPRLSIFALVSVFAAAFLAGAPRAMGADKAPLLAKAEKDASEKTVDIVDPAGAMATFYDALWRAGEGRPGAIARVAHYGDSLIEMDLLSGQARRRLQAAFGDAGHGFIHAARTRTWYRHDDVEHEPDAAWIAYQLNESGSPTRKYGYGIAVSAAYKAKAETRIGAAGSGPGSKVSRFEILTLASPDGGPVEVRIDGDKKGAFDTRGNGEAGVVRLAVPAGRHRLELAATKAGPMLLGVILENDGPGVVYDALGVNGIGASALVRADRDHWRDQLAHRGPDLVILAFGTNEATEKNLNVTAFKSGLTQVIGDVKKALPHASIVVMAPLDRAEKQGGALVTMPSIPKIVAAQKEAAADAGVAFWNAFEAMGGEGSMARWYQSKPRLASGDFMHPTRDGAKVLGDMWHAALMRGFAAHVRANDAPGQAPAKAKSPLADVPVR